MPIPTDTFWNVKKLNVVFMVSSLALLGVTVWTIFQDYGLLEPGRNWRDQQRAARVWEAAMTRDKIARDEAPDKQAAVDQLQKQMDDAEQQMASKRDRIDGLKKQIQKMESDRSVMEFAFNKLKANLA